MINGLSMDTAYLLSQMCPFNLCNIDFRSYKGSLYTNGVCFTLGINPFDNRGAIGVLFNFDLQSEADFDKSYETTTITTGPNILCIISPGRAKKHQLITEYSISGTLGTMNEIDCGYGYMLKSKDLNASLQYGVNSPVGVDDYNPQCSGIGVLLETVDFKPIATKWDYRNKKAYSIDGKLFKEDCTDFRTVVNALIAKQQAAKTGITV